MIHNWDRHLIVLLCIHTRHNIMQIYLIIQIQRIHETKWLSICAIIHITK